MLALTFSRSFFAAALLMSVSVSAEVLRLDLSQAAALAFQQNKLLAAERTGIEAASAGIEQADARFWPSVTASTGVVRTDSALNSFGFKLLQQQTAAADFDPLRLNNPDYVTNVQTRIEVNAPIYQGGALRAAKARAVKSLQAAKMGVEARKQKLLYDVIAAYTRVFQSKAQVVAAQKSYEAAQKHLKTTQALKRKGMVINSDVMDTNVHRLNAQIALTQAKNAYARSLDELGRLLNLPADTELQLEQPPILDTLSEDPRSLADWAAQNRPDIKALLKQNQASLAAIDERDAAFKPQLSVQLAKEWNSENFDLENDNTTLAAQLQWNLYAGGGDRAAVSAARARQLKIQYQIEDKQYEIRNAVIDAARLLEEAIQRQHVKQQAQQQSKEALRIRTLRHAQGLEKTVDLLASQAQLDVSRAEAIRATYDVTLARAALLLSAGKLTKEDIH